MILHAQRGAELTSTHAMRIELPQLLLYAKMGNTEMCALSATHFTISATTSVEE